MFTERKATGLFVLASFLFATMAIALVGGTRLASTRETLISFMFHANSIGAGQPVHQRNLVKALAFRYLDSIVAKTDPCKI